MARYLTIKDHVKEERLYRKRAATAMVLVVLMLLLLLARLYILQIQQHHTYATLSDNNRIAVLPITPNRGLIFDRNGVLLAENMPSFSLEITPEQVPDLELTISRLEQLLKITDDDKKFFHKQLQRKRRFEAIPILLNLSEEELASFAVNRHQMPGVKIAAGLSRHYPMAAATAHVLGYVSRINEQELQHLNASNYSATQHIGKVGIEKAYEDELHGTVGFAHVETNAHGRIARTLQRQDPIPGKTLHLTIDAQLQQTAYDAMAGKKGVFIAVDPDNGAVLAMVSTPSYDPNLFAIGLDQKTYRELEQAKERPLFNRALRGQYPPGSTIKPILGLQALAIGTISQQDKIFDPGWFKLPNSSHYYRDWRRQGHGWINLEQSISQSCSTFFYHLANKLGIEKMYSILHEFGFGMKTGIDIEGELPGLLPSKDWKYRQFRQAWFPGETLITGIGQGYTLVTPLQLANAATILANQGKKVPLHLVHTIDSLELSPNQQIEPTKATAVEQITITNQPAWRAIEKAMIDSTKNPRGTAFTAFHNARYQIAAKTGTAQVAGIKQGEEYDEKGLAKRFHDHSLLIGYAPVNHPKIAFAMLIENERGSALIARKVLDSFLLRTGDQT